MHRYLLDVLVCPLCQDEKPLSLTVNQEKLDRIWRGSLGCTTCAQTYPIEAGIPRFTIQADAPSVRRAFSKQWQLRKAGSFEKEILYLVQPKIIVQIMAHYLKGLLQAAPGQWGLDAGCGSCDKTACIAEEYPEMRVIGMDFTSSVLDNSTAYLDRPNLDFIQGDVTNPPLRKRFFDLIFSYGVLHHTSNTLNAFKTIAGRVRPGGVFYTWLYPDPAECTIFFKRYYFFRDRLFLGLGHRLPLPLLFYLIKLASWCVEFHRAKQECKIYGLSPRDYLKSMFFVNYDNVVPEYQFRHSRAEVADWYRQLGFTEIRTMAPPDFEGVHLGKLRMEDCPEKAEPEGQKPD